ncbi:hypothetical protein FPOAC2_04259 [Fusarium poae]|uniref:hypothetical protein n=1 Tax=Fusarium poae TaxID=36050 RepID=UPI001CE7D219|nr:hypothetical protein FPOAC1_004166 [Fusarium poae]KAG8670931.1 hypothetical protein FPOAC1_004166 [Fusarium poae]
MIDPRASHHVVSRWKLDLAARWYTIQSETLHIPDRFGFLTKGTPPSEVFEVERVIRLSLCQFCFLILLSLVFTRLPQIGISRTLQASGFILGVQFLVFGLFWALQYLPPRASSINWGTWEYSDDTAHINYLKEVFGSYCNGWDSELFFDLLPALLSCCVGWFWVDRYWVWLKVVAIVDEARKLLCGHW